MPISVLRCCEVLGEPLTTTWPFRNWEKTTGCSRLGAVMARMMGFRGRGCIGPGWRRQSEPKDGVGFAREFEKLLELDFRHALGGHGAPMKDTARDDLRLQVRRLYGIS